MALKVKLVRGLSGHPEDHRATVRGLGLTKVGRERILQDTPAIRGMVDKVAYLLSVEQTSEEFKPFGRRSRAKQQREASASKQQREPGSGSNLR
jgi:large subunit ribosomal protein L30